MQSEFPAYYLDPHFTVWWMDDRQRGAVCMYLPTRSLKKSILVKFREFNHPTSTH